MARTKSYKPHPDTQSGRVGLVVADFQTLHWGHVRLLAQLAATCDEGIVALGSSQKFGMVGHPFTFEQKKEMVQGVFGDTFRFLPLRDIDAGLETSDWIDYVLKQVKATGAPDPTDYFTGSGVDARYYTSHFAALTDPKHQEGLATVHVSRETRRRLHIVDRSDYKFSGRDVRFLIENRDSEWKQYVPRRLWRYVEMHYPPHLRTAIRVEEESDLPTDVAVGTRCLVGEARKAMVLKDDGKWRLLREGPDEKTRESLQRREQGGGISAA